MQLLCIAALLLSAVAAHPDSWRNDEKFLPAGEPEVDEDSTSGDEEQSMIQAPDDGHGGSDVVWPEENSGHLVWPRDLSPPRRPGNGRPQGPKKGTGDNQQPGKPSRADAQDKRHAFGFKPDEPRGPPFGNMRKPAVDKRMFTPLFKVYNVTLQNVTSLPLKEGETIFLMPKFDQKGPHHHHKDGKRGPPENVQYVKLTYSTKVPNNVSLEYGVLKPGNMVFSPVFKVDNVAFQNVTSLPLKEGETIFLMPKFDQKGPHHHHKDGKHGPPKNGQYVKLTYSTKVPNNASLEYGVLKPKNLGELAGDKDNLEEADW